ncbi:MAG: hypothetical protein MI747_02040 [Desulfobacterales bacterium]|nr:hypothetical protein [Desulfobacterales bacterium]
MINRNTVKTLGLKPKTRSMCYDLYVKINSDDDSPEAILEKISFCQDDGEELNRIWWVLNYYAEQMDPDRNLRAMVEHHLDRLAQERHYVEEEAG